MWMMTHCEGHQGEEGTRKLTQVRQQKLKACQEQSCVRAAGPQSLSTHF